VTFTHTNYDDSNPSNPGATYAAYNIPHLVTALVVVIVSGMQLTTA